MSDIQNHVEVTLTHQGVPWAKVLPLSQGEKQPVVPIADLNCGSIVMSEDCDESLEILNPRVAGFWQGQVKIADDFDETSDLQLFSGDFG
ncbi:hypothetical protein PN499_23685 [Kamptonema animale CS-326]|uniref:hypothetical protein n=1 Tax=Kamptonema animale TaxID=92934 RepID=UPI00232D06C0|nr:hypothetical protein [Kamptonema animale]MDB9514206.1 hypothetical protein [Kamptonema animale CS-326]